MEEQKKKPNDWVQYLKQHAQENGKQFTIFRKGTPEYDERRADYMSKCKKTIENEPPPVTNVTPLKKQRKKRVSKNITPPVTPSV